MDVHERPLPGGPLAIDLVNTEWRSDEGGLVDWFDDDAAVGAFLAEHQRPRPDSVEDARRSLTAARSLVRSVLETAGKPSEDLITAIDAALADAAVRGVADGDGLRLGFHRSEPAEQLAVDALVDAIELTRSRPDRLRACDREGCVLWFEDTSRGGRRRWCSMDRCGNRIKAQRHHARTRSG